MTDTLIRTVDGRDAPTAGKYEIDPSHSAIEAVARHMMFAKVRGRFSTFSGTIEVAERIEDSRVTVEIDAASVDTRDEQRDAHLRSPDFLDAETYPKLTFASTEVRRSNDGWTVVGDLTIRDATESATLDLEFLGGGTDPFGNAKLGFSATTQLDRETFGMTWNAPLEAGGVLVGKTLDVEINVQAVRQG